MSTKAVVLCLLFRTANRYHEKKNPVDVLQTGLKFYVPCFTE